MLIFSTSQFAFPIAVSFYLLSMVFYLSHRPTASGSLFLIGFAIHTIFQVSRSLFLGVWQPNNIFNGSYFLPWSLAFICLAMRCFSRDQQYNSIIKSIIIPVFLLSLPAMVFSQEIMPPGPKHETIFVSLYYSIDTMAQACFILGGWSAVFHLRKKDPGCLFNSFIVFGFILYSISQVIGAYWAYLGWALPMHWSTKHLQSASVWCYFAAVLHLRYFPTWNSKHEAWFAIAGALILLIFVYGHQISALSLAGIRS